MILYESERLKHTQFFKRRAADYYVEKGRTFPWRTNRSPYRTMVSEFMLQRTRASNVEHVFEEFIEVHPDIVSLAEADFEDLKRIMYPLGLPVRVERMLEAAKTISRRFNGVIPQSYSELLSVEGIGDYTARAIKCFGYGDAVGIIDVNVYRVVGRFFGIYDVERNPYFTVELRECIDQLVNKSRPVEYNFGILDISALSCKSRATYCSECTLESRCSYALEKSSCESM